MNEKKLLGMLEKNPFEDRDEMAKALKCTREQVDAAISRLEKQKVIVGYNTMVDWHKAGSEFITAYIELKISPAGGEGFDKVAKRIAKYPQVKNVSLMSGSYDLLLTVEGKTLGEVALFVSQKLAPMADVLSTATHFMLKKYKENGVNYDVPEEDLRSLFSI